jgi:hypothetical protein
MTPGRHRQRRRHHQQRCPSTPSGRGLVADQDGLRDLEHDVFRVGSGPQDRGSYVVDEAGVAHRAGGHLICTASPVAAISAERPINQRSISQINPNSSVTGRNEPGPISLLWLRLHAARSSQALRRAQTRHTASVGRSSAHTRTLDYGACGQPHLVQARRPWSTHRVQFRVSTRRHPEGDSVSNDLEPGRCGPECLGA